MDVLKSDSRDHLSVSLARSIQELNSEGSWFGRQPAEKSSVPFVVVVDGFYADPFEVRTSALAHPFVQYFPPLPDQVGSEVARPYEGQPGSWFSTSLLSFKGIPVRNPVQGFRLASSSIRLQLATTIGTDIPERTWDTLGDGWNGAFHLQNSNWRTGDGAIHHHYKAGDVYPSGWSGVLYLSPDAPASAGTSIWRSRATGLCVGSFGATFDYDVRNFELAFLIENRFNRLVLFREAVFHRAEHGFGTIKSDSRLTQTFFFVCGDHAGSS